MSINDDDVDDDDEMFGNQGINVLSPRKKSFKARKSSSSTKRKKASSSSRKKLLSSNTFNQSLLHQVMYPYIPVKWLDQDTQQHLTVFVHMPSGTSATDIQARIVENGTVLSLIIPWPKHLLSTKCIINKEALYNADSSKAVACEYYIKKLKGGIADKTLYSEMRIPLGMQVEKEFHNLTNRFTSQLIEHAIKVMRYKKECKSSDNFVYIAKFEMIGVNNHKWA